MGFVVLGAMSCSHESGGGISTNVPMVHAANPVKEAAKTMTAFHSDAELSRYLREVAAKQRHVMRSADETVKNDMKPRTTVGKTFNERRILDRERSGT